MSTVNEEFHVLSRRKLLGARLKRHSKFLRFSYFATVRNLYGAELLLRAGMKISGFTPSGIYGRA